MIPTDSAVTDIMWR